MCNCAIPNYPSILNVVYCIHKCTHKYTYPFIRHFYAHINTNFAIFKIYKFSCPITKLLKLSIWNVPYIHNSQFTIFEIHKLQKASAHTNILIRTVHKENRDTIKLLSQSYIYYCHYYYYELHGLWRNITIDIPNSMCHTPYSILHSSTPYIIQMKTKRTLYITQYAYKHNIQCILCMHCVLVNGTLQLTFSSYPFLNLINELQKSEWEI